MFSFFRFFRRPGPGEWGEAQAERHLRRKGYDVLGRRVRFSRRSELDLVARDGRTLVFVEVKTRASEDFGRPIEAVDREKRRSVSRAAIRYLKQLKQKPEFVRFDVVEVIGQEGGEAPAVRHIENAFALEGRFRWPW